jgi:hypothetical protein
MVGRGVAVASRAAVWWLMRKIKARLATDVSITAAARVHVIGLSVVDITLHFSKLCSIISNGKSKET